MADLIVLGGCVAIETASSKGGFDIQVPFNPGRSDASQEQTDIDSFNVMEPVADEKLFEEKIQCSNRVLLLDRAQLLSLTGHLVGGLRVLGANYDQSSHGVFTDKVGTLKSFLCKSS